MLRGDPLPKPTADMVDKREIRSVELEDPRRQS
jgi:hypothetical protein